MRLLHAVLVDAEAADPHVSALHVQVPVQAVLDQGVRDVVDLVAPSVAEHEGGEASVVGTVDRVH
eukprot:11979598-Heterocapsa_arctica.AAC.1